MFLEGSYSLLLVFKLSDVMTLDSVDFGVIYTIDCKEWNHYIWAEDNDINITEKLYYYVKGSSRLQCNLDHFPVAYLPLCQSLRANHLYGNVVSLQAHFHENQTFVLNWKVCEELPSNTGTKCKMQISLRKPSLFWWLMNVYIWADKEGQLMK